MLLNGRWWLATDPQNVGKAEAWFARGPVPGAQPVQVPGMIHQTFYEYHGVVWYWHTFVPPAAGPLHGHQIHFQGFVDYRGDVWLNGQYLGGYEGGECPFDVDASVAVAPGQENTLVVRVLNPTDEAIDGLALNETPHSNKVNRYRSGSGFNCGGIALPVELRIVPLVRAVDVFPRPNPHDGSVPVTVTLRNDTAATVPVRVVAELGAALPVGQTVEVATETALLLKHGEQTIELALHVAQPHLWNLDDPYLYRVDVRTEAQGGEGTIDSRVSVRCGFRELKVENGFFRLNGKRIFLRSTHTGNHMPHTWKAPLNPDLMRRDLIMAKASGFNCVRFIAGMCFGDQLDFCDELGLMVYEECYASWCLQDSPQMGARFDHNTSEMIRRDRNHPCLTIWGLLNETNFGPVYERAAAFLPQLRALDPTRLVLLGSGRWDRQWNVGSVSNPGSDHWEYVWGAEAPDAQPVADTWFVGGGRLGAGDVHVYPRVPQTPETNRMIRNLGKDTKPVFLSEYGIGSLLNVIRDTRRNEEQGADPQLLDVMWFRRMAERLEVDWQRLGFTGVYPFAEDMLKDSQRLHARQRLLGFDLIRSNPRICGFNLTGMLDHGISGEGLWSFTREWKPGIVDALCDGWAPVRWCLFVEPSHAYVGRAFHIEAVLANEDVLKPGVYPVTFRVCGPQGIAWEKHIGLRLPEPAEGGDAPLAVPALDEEITLSGPAGAYEMAAYMDHGGAPAGGRLRFYLTEAADYPMVSATVSAWGLEPRVVGWLQRRGVTVRPYDPDESTPGVILVGRPGEAESDLAHWTALAGRVAQGSVAVFMEPAALARGDASTGWLPLANKGRCYEFHDWLYHKECVAKAHPFLAGLQGKGIMDWEYYGPVISSHLFEGQELPDDIAVAAFATGHHAAADGYASGIMLAGYRLGAGQFITNTFHVLDNVDRQPTADRLLLNLVTEASRRVATEPAALPEDWPSVLEAMGYR